MINFSLSLFSPFPYIYSAIETEKKKGEIEIDRHKIERISQYFFLNEIIKPFELNNKFLITKSSILIKLVIFEREWERERESERSIYFIQNNNKFPHIVFLYFLYYYLLLNKCCLCCCSSSFYIYIFSGLDSFFCFRSSQRK